MQRSLLTLAIASLIAGHALADPVPLPNPGIAGYSFPEPEAQLLQWINTPTGSNTRSVYRHGWGLWASLTAPSGQTEFGLPNVPVYFTWLTPTEVAALPATQGPAVAELRAAAPRRFELRTPRQFLRIPGFSERREERRAHMMQSPASNAMSVRDTSSFEMVAYDPTTAEFVRKNQLLSKASLTKIYAAGNTAVPSFPNTAVAVKPVYKLVSKANMINGTLYVMPAWPGTPKPTPAMQTQGFPEDQWPGCVYIDSKNAGPSSANSTDASCARPNASNTFGLGDFIGYAITPANVSEFQQLVASQLKQKVEVGDVLILMAMHVTSREMTEWTWQTYFWTPNAAKPPLPSSSFIAAARPREISAPVAHYAMAIGYQMVAPNQPINGGKSLGLPVIAYNPYLEAGFPSNTFTAPPNNVGIYNPVTKKTFTGTLGIQTNCMTCHSGASVSMANNAASIGYATDFYIPRNDPMFKGSLQTDFLWSIADDAK